MKSEQEIEAIGLGERGSLGEPLTLVRLQNVSLGYNSVPVLQAVSMDVRAGSLVGVAGPNGSGKTTLFRSILGLLPVVSGAVRFFAAAHCRVLVTFRKTPRSILSFL
jgi:ABC-type branched-subunit amino acid transport system ATPase component